MLVLPGNSVVALNGETVNGKSGTQSKHGLVMTYPESDRDIMEVLTDLAFVNSIFKMEREMDWTQLKQMKNSQNKTVIWELVGTEHSSTE